MNETYINNIISYIRKKYPLLRQSTSETLNESIISAIKEVENSMSKTSVKKTRRHLLIVQDFFNAEVPDLSETTKRMNLRKQKFLLEILNEFTGKIYRRVLLLERSKTITNPNELILVQSSLSRGAINNLVKRIKEINYNTTVTDTKNIIINIYNTYNSISNCTIEEFLHNTIPNLGNTMCEEIINFFNLKEGEN